MHVTAQALNDTDRDVVDESSTSSWPKQDKRKAAVKCALNKSAASDLAPPPFHQSIFSASLGDR